MSKVRFQEAIFKKTTEEKSFLGGLVISYFPYIPPV